VPAPLAGVRSGVVDGEAAVLDKAGGVSKGKGWQRDLKGSAAESGMGRRRFRVRQGAVADLGRGRRCRFQVECGSLVGHERGVLVLMS